MKRVEGNIGKAGPLLEWEKCESEGAWRAALDAPATEWDGSRRQWAGSGGGRRWWWIGAIGLAAVLLLGGWVWHTANAGLAEVEAELRNAVEDDLWRAERGVESPTVKVLSLTGETAIVEYMVEAGPNQPVVRLTRVYRQDTLGWQRSKPTPEMWGSMRSQESAHFIFRYYTRDEGAVVAAAAKLERLFDERLAAWTAPDDSSGAQTVAKIEVTVDPSARTGAVPRRKSANEPLVVASPAAYLEAHTIADADLLAQAVFLSIVNEIFVEFRDRQGVLPEWKPLLDGLRLWLLWSPELPLAATREPVVQSVVSSRETVEPGISTEALRLEEQVCALYRLWMSTPIEIQVPIVCENPNWNEYLRAWRVTYRPPIQLKHLMLFPSSPDLQSGTGEVSLPLDPGYAVVLATVVEYVAATYGQERLPGLMASLDTYRNWEALTVGVFGVSAGEFEAGWRRYLVERYGVLLEP